MNGIWNKIVDESYKILKIYQIFYIQVARQHFDVHDPPKDSHHNSHATSTGKHHKNTANILHVELRNVAIAIRALQIN